jgi:DNA-binding LytR/AlgR family response regulator
MPMPVFNDANELVYIEIPTIFSIYKDPKSRKIIVEAECGEYYLPSTIEQLDIIMSEVGFMLIDKNRIINLDQIKTYENGVVEVDGSQYFVSKRKRKKLEELIDKRSRDTNGKYCSTGNDRHN